MGNEKVSPERLAHPFGQDFERDGRGVGTDRGARAADALQFPVKRLLDIGSFQHRLDDPVTIGQFNEVVFQVARLDQSRGAIMHEGRRFGFAQVGNRAFGQRIPVVGAVRDDIQQHHGNTSVGDLGGNARPHRAGADDTNLADRGRTLWVSHHTRSRIVAIPWPPPMHWLARA
jgi:hypothetical protein